jgi:hypothetical protein
MCLNLCWPVIEKGKVQIRVSENQPTDFTFLLYPIQNPRVS